MNLILIGYRGTGKSTVARRLAERLGWDWVDSDDCIERRAGKSIAEIFADLGEPGFRDLETVELADLCRREKTVLAVGGGAVLREENRKRLGGCGKVVWLQARPETIRRRLADDEATAESRPNLTKSGGLDEIEQVLAERTSIYRQCADLQVDTEGKAPDEVADEIVARLDLSPAGSDPA